MVTAINWTLPGDQTAPLITAESHVRSAHGSDRSLRLPKTCVIFEMGRALDCLEEQYRTVTLSERLPCFWDNPRCLSLEEHPQVCFTKGGYGAPAAVDTLETLCALGVEQISGRAGLCGVFVREVQVGRVLVPQKVLCEKGCSHHYWPDLQFVLPDRDLAEQAAAFFSGFFPLDLPDRHHRRSLPPDLCQGGLLAGKGLRRCRHGDLGPAGSEPVLLYACRRPPAGLGQASYHAGRTPWTWGGSSFQEICRHFVQRVAAFTIGLADGQP